MSPKPPASRKRYLPFIIIGVALIAVVGVTAYVLNSRGSESAGSSSPVTNSAGRTANLSPRPAARRPAGPGAQPANEKGGATAAVVLEEFGDYECPPCASFHPILQRIEDEYGDRIKVVFRNYPLQQVHKNAFAAARAAEAAGMQGKFWEMNDLIYDNQKTWKDSPEPRPLFIDYARRLDLNPEKFKADMESQKTAERIIADQSRGSALGVTGTPTVFLNGRELTFETIMSEPKLRVEIDAALASAKGSQ